MHGLWRVPLPSVCSHSFKRLLDPPDSRRSQNEALDHELYRTLPKCSVCSKLTSYAQENAFYLQDMYIDLRLPRWLSGKESTCQGRRCKKHSFNPWDDWDRDDPMEKMATHSSILSCNIPCTEEPGRLQSMESRRVRHNWVTEHAYKSKLFSKTQLRM